MKQCTLHDSVRTVLYFWIPITVFIHSFIHSFTSRWSFLKFLSIYWVSTKTEYFGLSQRWFLTCHFFQANCFLDVWLLSNLFFYFLCSLSLWSLFIGIWWNSELPTTLSFFGRNILIHLSDVGLLHSVPYTGGEVNYSLLHFRKKKVIIFIAILNSVSAKQCCRYVELGTNNF
jgi:hypothetical protein